MARARGRLRRVDADGAWKRVLSEMLAEFVAFALPELHAAIDWSREPVFLEQELRPVLRQAAVGRRVADLVAQVWLQNGATTWLLAHVEIQGRAEADFAARMFAYAALLNLRYHAPRAKRQVAANPPPAPPAGLVGVAVLTDTDAGWRPSDYGWGWGEYGITYRFKVLKLADWRAVAATLEDDRRPFAWVIQTWLAVQDAGRTEDAQADARRTIGRRLVAARRAGSLDAAQAFAIYTFLDALGGLPDALGEAIDQELQLVGEATMPEVLNRYERRALARGREEGREEVVLLLLAERCGPLDTGLQEQVTALDGDALLALGKALLDFTGQDDLRQWLARHAARD
jgi:hypothetical protein